MEFVAFMAVTLWHGLTLIGNLGFFYNDSEHTMERRKQNFSEPRCSREFPRYPGQEPRLTTKSATYMQFLVHMRQNKANPEWQSLLIALLSDVLDRPSADGQMQPPSIGVVEAEPHQAYVEDVGELSKMLAAVRNKAAVTPPDQGPVRDEEWVVLNNLTPRPASPAVSPAAAPSAAPSAASASLEVSLPYIG